MANWFHRLLARQFAQPSGALGRLLIAPWLNRMSREDNRLMLARLALGSGDDFLEIGFGGGDLLAAALTKGQGAVTGIDISPDIVARGRKRFQRQSRVTLVEGRATDLPLATNSADRVASLHNLYFWDDPARAFAEIHHVLRPQGRVVIGFEPAEQMRQWPGHEHGFRLWTGEEAAQLMHDAGFENVRHETVQKAVDVTFVSGTKAAKRPAHDHS
ncbi:MAG: class I SAM-dependent methyltransferase [Pacificimonas sp.]